MADDGGLTDADLGIAPSPVKGADKGFSDADLGIGPPSNAGALANTHDEGWLSGGLKGTGTAVIKGLANIPGSVKNYGNLVDYLMARGHAAITGRPLDEVQQDLQQRYATASKGASDLTGGYFKAPEAVLPSGEDIAAPILKKTGEYEPSTDWGKYGMAGVETATSMIGPGGGGRVVSAPINATKVVPRIVETAVKPAIKAAPLNAAAGAGAQAATDLTGDPLYGMAVGLGAGAVGEGAVKTAKAIAKPFAQDIPVIGRAFDGTRETEVGKQILGASTNPQEVERKLFPGPMRPGDSLQTETIPGSQPTLAQWVGKDQGLNNAEMAARNEAGTAGHNDPFAAVDKAQNKARLDALEQTAPAGADTMKPSEVFQAHLDHIDQSTEQAINQLTQNAQAAVPKGTLTPEDAGGVLRTAIESAKTAAKEVRNKLYDAIDPDGKLNAVATPARDTTKQVVDSIGEYTPPIENAALKDRILPRMQEMPDVMSLRDLGEIEKDVTNVMSKERKANGDSPDYRRLTQLKGSLRDAINNAIDNQQKYEAAAVARGEMQPQDTMEARLRQTWGVPDEQVQSGRQRFNAATGTAGAGAGARRPAGKGAPLSAGSSGADSQAGRGFPTSAGDQGVSSNTPLIPNLDDAAIDRVNAAKTSATEYGKTYKSEPIAGALKGPFKGQYNKPAGALPGEAFAKGDKGYEAAGAFLKAADDSPDAVAALKDHARSVIAKGAIRPDGTLDPVKYNKLRSDYDGAFRAIEERSPRFTSEFSTAVRATDQMLAAQAARKQELGDFQKSQASAFLGKQTPTEVENTIGQILKTKDLSTIDGLIKQATDPAVLDGLKKGGVDWMVKEFTDTSADRWMKSAKFRDFVNDRYEALAKLYGTDRANMFRAIADDLASADQPSKATAPKRGPGTAKDVAPLLKKAVEAAKHPSLLNAMTVAGVGGFEAHGFPGALYGAGAAGAAYAIGTLRAAGVKTMQDMFRDALSNPERARYYISKVQPKEHALSAVTRSLRRELLLSKPIGADEPAGRASGGRVNTRDYPAKKASHIEKQMNRICKAYGGELNPMLHADDNAVARAMRIANRGRFADGGRIAPPEEGTVEGPTLNPFGIDPDQIRQITGLKPQGPLPGPLGLFGADTAKNAVEGTVNAATLPGDVYLGKADLNTPEGFARAQNMAGMITSGGMPMAETGAVGSAGGKLFDPTKYTNIDPRKSVPVNNNRTPAYQRALDEHDSIMARWDAALKAAKDAERVLGRGTASEFELAQAHKNLNSAHNDLVELEPRMREPDPYYEPTISENGGLQNVLPRRIDRYFSSEGPRNAANERASGGRIALRLAYNR